MPALRDDDVRSALGGFHKLLVHGLDRGEVLVDHAVQTASAIPYIAHDTPQDAHIRIGVYKDFDIHLITEFLAGKNQNSLYQNDLRRADQSGLLQPVMDGVVIQRHLNGFSCFQRPQILQEQLRIKRIRVVVVDLCPFLKRCVMSGFIIIVIGYHADVTAETLHQSPRDGGFAAAGTAGDADDHDFMHHVPSVLFFSPYHTIERPVFQSKFRLSGRRILLCGTSKVCIIVLIQIIPISGWSV